MLIVLLMVAFSCENITEPDDNKIKIEVALSGAVQKGPFLNGTSVLISELEGNLTPTGRNFSSQIENNAGIFQLPSVEYSSQYVELKADGYYYNEISGSASSSPITLYALSDITNRESVNINMFTTLERPRIKQLINNGLTFSMAKDSTYKDILRAFSFPLDSIINSEDLNISAAGEENAKLLAVSLILQGPRTEAELSELISNISFDLQTDGQINSSSITTGLFQSVNSLDTTSIRGNLEARFDELGIDATISNFEKYINILMQTQNDIVIAFERVISCDGDSSSSIDISVLGGEPPYTYQWSNGATSEDIENIGPDIYSVIVTDAYNQTKTSDDIIIPGRMVLTSEVTHVDDLHSEGSIDLTVTGGEAPYTYNWSNGSTNEDISGLELGVYTVTVTDINNCEETTTVEIYDATPVIDIDGNLYHVIKIGNQYWLKENLKVTHYRNGDAIPNVTDSTEWTNLTTGAYCEYDNNPANVDTYGRLYNWYTVDDSRNIAPEGWHVPSDDEWKALEMTLGMSQSEADNTGLRGTDQASQLAGNADLWTDGDLENNAVFGSSGFAAFPGGYRYGSNGGFYYMGGYASFWSSTEGSSSYAWGRVLRCNYAYVGRYSGHEQYGFSVRLVRD